MKTLSQMYAEQKEAYGTNAAELLRLMRLDKFVCLIVSQPCVISVTRGQIAANLGCTEKAVRCILDKLVSNAEIEKESFKKKGMILRFPFDKNNEIDKILYQENVKFIELVESLKHGKKKVKTRAEMGPINEKLGADKTAFLQKQGPINWPFGAEQLLLMQSSKLDDEILSHLISVVCDYGNRGNCTVGTKSAINTNILDSLYKSLIVNLELKELKEKPPTPLGGFCLRTLSSSWNILDNLETAIKEQKEILERSMFWDINRTCDVIASEMIQASSAGLSVDDVIQTHYPYVYAKRKCLDLTKWTLKGVETYLTPINDSNERFCAFKGLSSAVGAMLLDKHTYIQFTQRTIEDAVLTVLMDFHTAYATSTWYPKNPCLNIWTKYVSFILTRYQLDGGKLFDKAYDPSLRYVYDCLWKAICLYTKDPVSRNLYDTEIENKRMYAVCKLYKTFVKRVQSSPNLSDYLRWVTSGRDKCKFEEAVDIVNVTRYIDALSGHVITPKLKELD